MKNKVGAFIQELQMTEVGDRVLCGISGGADSVAMVMLLKELGFSLVCGHFIHGIRPEYAESELALVQNLCTTLGIPLFWDRADVPDYCKTHKCGLEEGARTLRYAFLEKLADAEGCTKIATAHNMNDNAETVILNLTRGTGLQGLSGIPPVRGRLIRPLLCLTRQEIEGYLKDTPVVEDASNQDTKYTRNHIRLQVIPKLLQVNSRAVENIAAAAFRVRQENRIITQTVDVFLQKNLTTIMGAYALYVPLLKTQEPALLARVIHKVYSMAGGNSGKLSSVHINSVLELVAEKLPPKYIVMPSGIEAKLKNKNLLIYKCNTGGKYETRH